MQSNVSFSSPIITRTSHPSSTPHGSLPVYLSQEWRLHMRNVTFSIQNVFGQIVCAILSTLGTRHHWCWFEDLTILALRRYNDTISCHVPVIPLFFCKFHGLIMCLTEHCPRSSKLKVFPSLNLWRSPEHNQAHTLVSLSCDSVTWVWISCWTQLGKGITS